MGPTNRWKLGLFVVTCFLGALVLLSWAGASRLDRESIRAWFFFDEVVDGLSVGSPVKFRGVPIGKVAHIQAAPDHRRVEVGADIFIDSLERIGLSRGFEDTEHEVLFVPEGLRVQLVTSLLTGDSFIQSDFFDPESHPVPDYPFEVPLNTVPSVPSATKSLGDALLVLAERVPSLIEETMNTLRTIEGALREARLGELSQRASSALASVEQLFEQADGTPIIQQSVDSLEQAQRTLAELEGLLNDIRREGHVAEIGGAVTELGRRLGDAAGEVASLSSSLRRDLNGLHETLSSIRRLTELLERDPGALLHGHSQRSLDEIGPR